MAIGFKHGAGGGGYELNFRVINANNEPSSPKENSIWIKTTNLLNCWTYGPDVPLRRSKNKNFATYPYASVTNTSSGVTFTDNGDGTVTVNGTASKDVYFRGSKATAEEGMMLLPAGTYTISGCPSGGSASTFMVQLVTMDDDLKVVSTINEYGSGNTVTLTRDTYCRMNFFVKSGAKVSNLNVYFQVEAGSSKTAFERGNANGQVWIKPYLYSTVSFDAFKRNSKGNRIILQPGECWLFRTGYGWQNYTNNAKIYQNGVWSALMPLLYLYNKGGSTGYSFACDTTMKQLSSGWGGNADRVTVGSSSINVATSASRAYDFTNIFVTDTSGSFVTVDLSKYTKVRIKGTVSGVSENNDCVFRVLTAMGDLCTENNAVSQSFVSGTIDATVDISAINSSCYLGFTFYNPANPKGIIFELTELWLE